MTLRTFTIDNDEGEEIEVTLPVRFEVCSRCEGKGKHVDPAVDEGGISPEEFAEDPDFEEGYFEGRYDVTCHECDGLRVSEVVDEERVTDAQRPALDAYREHHESVARRVRERRAEMRMGY